jgi:hypothetical protein
MKWTRWFTLIPLLFLEIVPAAGAAPLPATFSVCAPRILFVLREDGGFWDPAKNHSIEILGAAVPATLEVSETPTFLRAVLPEDLPGGAALEVRVLVENEEIARGTLSTQTSAQIEQSTLLYRFEVSSQTPLAEIDAESLRLVEVLEKSRATETGTTLERIKEHRVDIERQATLGDCEVPPITEGSGALVIRLRPGDRLSDGSEEIRLTGLRDLFGQEIVAKGKLTVAKTPKGKEDAFVFAKGMFESVDNSRGLADTLALDLKVQPIWQMTGRWMFRPELSANISKNVPNASNAIRLAALFSNTTVRREGALVAQTRTAGLTTETDRNFDRVNLLADLRWQPDFRGQYQSREARRLSRAAKLGKKPDEVALLRTGYGYDLRIGLEAGASASRQSITKSQQTIDLDRFEILRLRPHVHAFYETGLFGDWQLTLDLSAALRYLFETELTDALSPGGTLLVREVDGFEPYTEATLALSFDPGQHLALALTYKNGAEPPTWVEVDKYSVGIVAKY